MRNIVNKQRYRKTKILVSLALFSILIISVVFIGFGTARVHPFKPKYQLLASLEHAASIVEGMPVTLVGIEIGQVKEITLGGDNKVRVAMEILESVQSHIRQDSVVELNQPPIGSSSLDISMGNLSLPMLRDGDHIALTKKVILDDVLEALHPRITQFDSILENVRVFTANLNDEKGQLQTLLQRSNDNLVALSEVLQMLKNQEKNIDNTVVNVHHASVQLNDILANTQQIISDTQRVIKPLPEFTERLPSLAENMERLSLSLLELSKEVNSLTPDVKRLIQQSEHTVSDTGDVIEAVKTLPMIHPAFRKNLRNEGVQPPRDHFE